MRLNFACFDQSWFYIDSRNDLSLLQRVTHPAVAGPDKFLRVTAHEQGRQILTLRGTK